MPIRETFQSEASAIELPSLSLIREYIKHVKSSVLSLYYAGRVFILRFNRLGFSRGLEAISPFDTTRHPVRRVVRLVLQKCKVKILYLWSCHFSSSRQRCKRLEVSNTRGRYSVKPFSKAPRTATEYHHGQKDRVVTRPRQPPAEVLQQVP
jgi:hypothetical protein